MHESDISKLDPGPQHEEQLGFWLAIKNYIRMAHNDETEHIRYIYRAFEVDIISHIYDGVTGHHIH